MKGALERNTSGHFHKSLNSAFICKGDALRTVPANSTSVNLQMIYRQRYGRLSLYDSAPKGKITALIRHISQLWFYTVSVLTRLFS